MEDHDEEKNEDKECVLHFLLFCSAGLLVNYYRE